MSYMKLNNVILDSEHLLISQNNEHLQYYIKRNKNIFYLYDNICLNNYILKGVKKKNNNYIF